MNDEEKIDNCPAVILVNPQLAENVGMAARAMLNCALYDLRLVGPREDCLSAKAISASSGAEKILYNAKKFETLEDAVEDLNLIYATTARRRDMVKEVLLPTKACENIKSHIESSMKCGFVFGPERTGLSNDHVALSDAIVEVPLDPEHCSLNLSQAVLLIGYEWFKMGDNTKDERMFTRESEIATKGELVNFLKRLEDELIKSGFLRVEEKRDRMIRNIRNIFERPRLTSQEISTLHGIVHDLVTYRERSGDKK